MSNKTRLQTNNTNLQALIDKANALPDAGGSGGGSGWINVSLLPTTYAAPPEDDSGSSIYYYEVPENCIGVAFICRQNLDLPWQADVTSKINNEFSLIIFGTGALRVEDADGTGTILKITNSYTYAYLLPILQSDLS